MNDKKYECQKKGRGYSNPVLLDDRSALKRELNSWQEKGYFTLTIGQRRDKYVFDDEDPPDEIEDEYTQLCSEIQLPEAPSTKLPWTEFQMVSLDSDEDTEEESETTPVLNTGT